MTTPYYEGHGVTLYHGDCLDVLRADVLGYDYRLGYADPAIPDASVDAVVTDPPYGLEFMGKDWDAPWKVPGTGRGVRVTEERAAEMTPTGKGHVTSAGPYLAARVDSVRVAGPLFQQWCEAWAAECLRVLNPGGHMIAFGGTRTWHRLACAVENAGFEIRDSIAWLYGEGFPKSLDVSKAIDKAAGAERPVIGRKVGATNGSPVGLGSARSMASEYDETTPATAAAAWSGWGTALKPAFEPAVVARKPLAGTVAANVLQHGTGALNVDACRIGDDERARMESDGTHASDNTSMAGHNTGRRPAGVVTGRWPANVTLDETQAAALDELSGTLTSGDAGGASLFFYVAKANADERPRVAGVAHPTVKPLNLMRWLVRLVTPPGGTVLEPFAGSGTTIEACILEGFQCVAVEKTDEYLPLILARIHRQKNPVEAIRLTGDDLGLFEEWPA